MLPKIRYRLCYNYANRLNKDGRSNVALEVRQGQKKAYFKSNVLLYPDQWERGMVVNHDNASKLTAYLIHWMHEIEEIELDALLKGKHLSLFQLKMAIKTGVRSNASIAEFAQSIIKDSTRSHATKKSYETLIREIEKANGKITLDDITYDWIEKWRVGMRDSGLSENTIKGRLKQLHCLTQEAIKRNLITDDPFKYVTIGNMTARVGYLEQYEVEKLEALTLTGKEEKIRDLFLLACYTGLRWSDLSTLEEAEIINGVLHKKMLKTSLNVHIPINTLFWGKGRAIIDKYEDITTLSHCVKCNSTANRILKDLATKAGINKKVYFHLGRKTCSNMLNALGMDIQDISAILGHTKVEVTKKHYLFNNSEHLQNSVDKIFKKDD